MLDDLESLAIEMNQSLVPDGYNIQSGGGNYTSILPHKRKRAEDAGLPKYIKRVPGGFAVDHYPSSQVTTFSSSTLKSEELVMAKAWLAQVEAGQIVQRRTTETRRWHLEDTDLPKGIFRLRNEEKQGYYARADVNGRKKVQFGCPDETMEEKLAKAKAWLTGAKAGNVSPARKRLPKTLPTYVERYCGVGYRVRKPGYPVKHFMQCTTSDEENLQRATAYLELCK